MDTKDIMKPIEIFENLVEPLRLELGNDSWEFLLKRGEMFISQLQPLESQNSQTQKEIGQSPPQQEPPKEDEVSKIWYWYACQIHKTIDEFDEYDRHICRVVEEYASNHEN